MPVRSRAVRSHRNAVACVCLSLHGVSALVRECLQHVDADRREQLRYTRGESKPWRRIGASGVQSTYWFCGDCGGRIYGQRDARPDIIAVRAGTLDDTSWLQPVAHVYMRSAQPWEQMPNDTEWFNIMPKEFWSLADKLRSRWGPGLRRDDAWRQPTAARSQHLSSRGSRDRYAPWRHPSARRRG
jgi:hypothetical protein